jgi:hypothetical protein
MAIVSPPSIVATLGVAAPHAPSLPTTGGATVTDRADATGSIVEHVPSHTVGASNGSPGAPGQAIELAVIVLGRKHWFPEGEHVHPGEHVTLLGGASRKPVLLAPGIVTAGHGGGVEPAGPDHSRLMYGFGTACAHWPVQVPWPASSQLAGF